MKVLLENIGRDNLKVYRNYEEFKVIFENDPDFEEENFKKASEAIYKYYQEIAPNEKEITDECLLRVAI